MPLTPIPTTDLTPKQREAWAETRTALLYSAPMFSHLLYSMMTGPDQEQAFFTHDVDTAASDDERIIINPETFLPRPLEHRVFIAAHEVCHAMFRHSGLCTEMMRAGHVVFADGKKLPYNDLIMNHAQDYFINALLIESNIGSLPPDGLVDTRFTTKMSVLDIYRVMYEEQEKKQDKNKPEGDGGAGGNGEGAGKPQQGQGKGQGFDKLLPPGTAAGSSPQAAMDARDEGRWQAEIQAAAESALAQGKLPGALQQALGKLQVAETHYSDVIRSLLDRTVGTGAYDFRTPDRRMITRDDPVFAPGRRGFKCRLLVLVGDSSGSINPATVNEFMAQACGILEEMEPERILFTWCDAKTHGWQEITCEADIERIHKEGAKGRGGTNFCPVFEEIEAMGEQPEALIYLTDGYGKFPKEPPPYQVIWGSITTEGTVKYPFGEVVQVPVRAE
jgi:predicted metal-dependent peptidase